MERIRDIFKEENFTLLEYSSNQLKRKSERLKINVLNPNEILIDLNTGGKNTPIYIEALLKLPRKETGKLHLVIETIKSNVISSLDISTNYDNVGKNFALYPQKKLTILNLKETDYISFKFSPYCEHTEKEVEKVKIKSV